MFWLDLGRIDSGIFQNMFERHFCLLGHAAGAFLSTHVHFQKFGHAKFSKKGLQTYVMSLGHAASVSFSLSRFT